MSLGTLLEFSGPQFPLETCVAEGNGCISTVDHTRVWAVCDRFFVPQPWVQEIAANCYGTSPGQQSLQPVLGLGRAQHVGICTEMCAGVWMDRGADKPFSGPEEILIF